MFLEKQTAHSTRVYESTGYKFLHMYCLVVKSACDLMFESSETEHSTMENYVDKTRENLRNMHDIVQGNSR